MKDRSKVLVFVALVLLFVALSTLEVHFLSLGITGTHILRWLAVGLIILLLVRTGCCRTNCNQPEPKS